MRNFRNRSNIAILILLFSAMMAIFVFWFANKDQRTGPEYETGSIINGQAIEGQNQTVQVVPTIAIVNCLNDSIVCDDGGSGRLDLSVPTATPQPTATPGAGGSVAIHNDGVLQESDVSVIDFETHGVVCVGGTCDITTDLSDVDIAGILDISDHTNLVAGNNLTFTDDQLDVDDSFLLNTGDTGTGAYDFGGATDLEIPNGFVVSPDTDGEILIDTSQDQFKYFSTAERALTYRQVFSGTLENPTDADNFLLWKVPFGITVTNIACIVDPADSGESVVIDIQERDGSGDSPVSVDSTITCINTGSEDDGTLTNPVIDPGDWMGIDIGTVTGTVSQLIWTVVYFVTPS